MKLAVHGKRTLSLAIAAAMAVSLCSPAMAQSATPETAVVEESAGEGAGNFETDEADKLNAQLMTLDNGGEDAESTVTANDDNVAMIGDTGYETLTAAIDAVADNTPTTITLQKDVNEGTVTIPANKIITIELNGHTVAVSGAYTAIVNSGDLTLQDSTGNGGVSATDAHGSCVGLDNNAKNARLTIKSGKYDANDGTILTGKATGATINIEGGEFYSADNAVIMGNGSEREGEPNTINISGGTFTGAIRSEGYIACGIYAPWKDIVTVSGGTFDITDGAGIVARAGSVTVSGDATFNVTGNMQGWVGDKSQELPCSVFVFDNTNPAYPAVTDSDKIKVEGGNFKADVDVIAVLSDEDTNKRVEVTGGTFSSDPSAFVPENCTVTPESDGRFTVAPLNAENAVAQIGDRFYSSLVDAIANVNKGETIALLKDVDNAEGVSVPSGSEFTVDFGGHTYTLNQPGAGSPNTETNGFQFLKDSNITLKDGTIRISEQNGHGGAGKPIGRIIQNYADLTLENMQIYAANQWTDENYALSFNCGNITFTGNTSVYTTNPANTIAFDVCYWLDGGYTEGTYVTFDENYTGTIEGLIEYNSTDPAKGTLTINGNGQFQGVKLSSESVNGVTISITGGNFAVDPSDYLADGKTVVAGDQAGYPFKVTDAAANSEPAEVVLEEPKVENPAANDETATDEEKQLAVDLGEKLDNVTVEQDELRLAAYTVANENTVTEDEGKDELKTAGISVGDKDVSIVVQPYLDITLTDTQISDDTQNFTLDITPMYRKVATTDADNVIVKGETVADETANAVVLGEPAELSVTRPVEITVPLTPDFTDNDTLLVHHRKDDGTRYVYDGTVSEGKDNVTFTNPNGFSLFTISTDLRKAVITLDGVQTTLTAEDLGQPLPGAEKPGYTFQGLAFDGVEGTWTVLTEDLLDKLAELYKGEPIVATAVYTQNPAGESGDTNNSETPASTPAPTPAPTPVQDDGTVYYTCPACGYHDWTATADGYQCDHCAYLESAKQLSSYGNVKGVYEPKAAAAGSAAAQSAIPQTSDESNPALWAMLCALSAAALLGLGIVHRKRQ